MTDEWAQNRGLATAVTIQQLHEMTTKLINSGHGDLPVYISYETVFGEAFSLDFVKPSKRSDVAGLFVEGR